MGARARGRWPDFLVIGAAKSGTTTLYHYLARHPGIHMSPQKEPCFFDADRSWRRGPDWYRSLFAGARDDQACGEASTNYTRFPQVPGVPERIAALVPGAKLVYLLRDPVERAYAHYVHRWTKELHPGLPFAQGFEEFVARDPMCLDGSDYLLQVGRYLPHFRADALHVLYLDDLVGDPARALRRLFRFLGVDEAVDVVGGRPLRANDREGFHRDQIRARVTEPLRRRAWVRRLAGACPQGVRDQAYALLRHTRHGRAVDSAFRPPPMQEATRRALRERFGASSRALAERLGLPPPPWDLPSRAGPQPPAARSEP
jgi:hypothetical protein